MATLPSRIQSPPAPSSDFVRISERLLGEAVDHMLAAEYLERFLHTPQSADWMRFVDIFKTIEAATGDIDKAIADQIMTDDALRNVVGTIISFWYFAQAPGDHTIEEVGPPAQYFRGQFWDIVHAHPPGLSGGYFGHWTYPPDN